MAQTVVIVGAGLIGVMSAVRLRARGAEVTLIDAGQPGALATGASFGWLNAGYYLSEAHFRLRRNGIAAWHRLEREIDGLGVEWCGCLSWDVEGAALEARAGEFARLGYPAQRLARAQIAARVPELSRTVSEALWLAEEGIAEPGAVFARLLRAALEAGVRLISGAPVTGLETRAERISGVALPGGVIAADAVLIAAGTGACALLGQVDVPLPMLTRPGALVRSRPVPRVLDAVMVSPDLEFRQDRAGRIIAPSAAGHQSDDSEVLEAAPDVLGADTVARLAHWLPGVALHWDEVTLAMRPVPGDGLPVVGRCGPEGLHVAVMHSGITLGALMGELVAGEIHGGQGAPMLAPFRPQRFS